jgi:formate dehydrogenase major subunit
MFEIKHTLCPSCSVGCGINVILDDEEIVGTFPYKRHPVNEGKNCSNGRSSIETVKDSLSFDLKVLNEVIGKLKSGNNDKTTVIFSGNNSNEDLQAIKSLCESKGFNILAYADNLKDFESVASYDDVENASNLFVIGNILYENPLIGRRIVRAKENGAKIYVNDDLEGSPTSNIADEFTSVSVKEFIENNSGNFDDESIIVFNKVDSAEDLDLIENAGSKVLPVYSKSNTKGALNLAEATSKEDALELLNNTDILLVFNDDIVNEFDFDFKSISQVITFAPSKNDTTEISDFVIPIKSWLESEGSFTNAEGLTQEFSSVCETDKMGVVEIIEKINGDLE